MAQHRRVKALGREQDNKVSAEEDHSLLYLRALAFYVCAKNHRN